MKTRKLPMGAGLALAFAAATASSDVAVGRYELVLSGPVESVDRATNSITVLGHKFTTRDVSATALGRKINVYRSLEADRSLGSAILQYTPEYASSSDRVLVVGRVDAIDRGRGHVLVEGALVDYNSLLANATFSLPKLGAMIEVVGTQPGRTGIVLAGAISSAFSAPSSGQAVGTSSGGHAVGTSSGGHAVGTSSGGHAVGTSSGGQALGTSSGGQALGTSSGGQAVGTSSGGATSS